MKATRYDQLVAETPGLRHILHACSVCGAVGSRPGILATPAGDYGWREWVPQKFNELRLNAYGRCEVCAQQCQDG